MSNIHYDNSNESYFVQGDPNLKSFNHLLDLFGDVEYLFIGVTATEGATDVFTPATIDVVHELTEFLESRPEVTQVRSLSKYEYTHSDGGLLATDDLIEDRTDPQALAQARRIIVNEPMAMDTLVTDDLRHTRIAARVRYEAGSTEKIMSLMQATHQFIADRQFFERGFP